MLNHLPKKVPSKVILLGLLTAFVVASLPFAATYLFHYPDERHYTDGGIQMAQGGDLLIPHTADGSLRLRKPIVTYWLVAGSYALFGVSPFTSRLPFVLAGCGIVWLTFRLARKVLGTRRGALTATAIVASHPVLILVSTFAIPDVLLSLCMLLSIYGFVGLLIDDPPRPEAYWTAYLGVGLAAATKGIPALAVLLTAWTFALANPWRRLPLRRLVHLPSMMVGAIIGLGWYVAVLATYGIGSLRIFWLDQAGARVAPNPWQTLYCMPLVFLIFLGTFCVWVLPCLCTWTRWNSTNHTTRRSLGLRFLLTWTVAMVVLVGVMRNISVRYILYATPAWSIVLAAVFGSVDQTAMNLWLRRSLYSTGGFVLFFLALAATFYAQLQLGHGHLWIFAACAVPVVSLMILGRRLGGLAPTLCLSLAVTLLFPSIFLVVRGVALPDQGTQVARSLRKVRNTSTSRICVVGPPALAAKVRVCAGGKMYEQSRYFSRGLLSNYDVVLLPDTDASRAAINYRRIVDASSGLKDVDVFEMLLSLCRGSAKEYLSLHQTCLKMAFAY